MGRIVSTPAADARSWHDAAARTRRADGVHAVSSGALRAAAPALHRRPRLRAARCRLDTGQGRGATARAGTTPTSPQHAPALAVPRCTIALAVRPAASARCPSAASFTTGTTHSRAGARSIRLPLPCVPSGLHGAAVCTWYMQCACRAHRAVRMQCTCRGPALAPRTGLLHGRRPRVSQSLTTALLAGSS